MKRMGTKRLMTAALSVVIAAMLSISALAAYVPTKITYVKSNGSTSTATYKYSKSGNPTKRISSDGSTTTYQYKKNCLSKVIRSNGYTTAYEYEKGTLKSIILPSYTLSYQWNGSKASVIDSDDSPTTTRRETATKNRKNRITSNTELYTDEPYSIEKKTYKYYGNGNIKSLTFEYPGYSKVWKFNKNGYITSSTEKSGSYTLTEKFKYKMNKSKKCPKSVTKTYSDGSSPDHWTFSKFKKVKKSKNCDAWGNMLPLGVNSMLVY